MVPGRPVAPFGLRCRRLGARGRPRAGPGRRRGAAARPRSRATTRSSPRRPATSSTPAASGSDRCSCCWPRSSATRTRRGCVPAAVVVELTHLATLYHDDVMDEAPLRRGAASANARWDNTVAILTGDFLFARASDLLADLGPEAVRIQARTFERLCTGQIRETVGPADGQDPLEHYLSVARRQDRLADRHLGPVRRHDVRRRTTSWSRCSRGSASGSASPSSSPTTCSTSPASRPSRARPRAPTCARACRPWPAFHALRSTDPADARLRELLSRPLPDDDEHAEALALLRAHPAMDLARADLKSLGRPRPVGAAAAARRPGPRRARGAVRRRARAHQLSSAGRWRLSSPAGWPPARPSPRSPRRRSPAPGCRGSAAPPPGR